MKSRTPLERFWSKVDRRGDGDCWYWTGAAHQRGYGKLRWGTRTVSAHRISYEIHRGPVPPGLYVCHHCDEPACVNPRHLYVGCAADNNRDTRHRGRRPATYQKSFAQQEKERRNDRPSCS